MSDPLTRLLSQRDVLILDGAMGTNLFALGLANGAPGELWNVERPADVRSVYQGFVDAGSDIVLTNSFGSNRFHRPSDGTCRAPTCGLIRSTAKIMSVTKR